MYNKLLKKNQMNAGTQYVFCWKMRLMLNRMTRLLKVDAMPLPRIQFGVSTDFFLNFYESLFKVDFTMFNVTDKINILSMQFRDFVN